MFDLNTLTYDLPEEDYHADRDFVSNTWLKQVKPTPAHLKAYLDDDSEPSPQQANQLLEGNVIHTMLLEPEKFDQRYVVGPDVNKNTKIWKAAKKTAEDINMEIIDLKLHNKAKDVHQAIYRKKKIVDLLNGKTEVSGFWIDDTVGAGCKFRCDMLPDHGLIPDLKTTQIDGGASPEGFGKILWNMEYALQPAHYLPGLEQCGYEIDWDAPWAWIVVELNPPYESNIFVLTPELLAYGQQIRSERIEIVAECLNTDRWPGYDDTVKTPILPAWAHRQIENI